MSESSQNRNFRKELEKRLGKTIIGIGQIDAETFETAQRQQGKFTEHNEQASGVLLNKYKVRICHATNESESVNNLIDVYGQASISGLRAEICPVPVYPVNTYVVVYKDPLTDLYYIDEARPNSVVDLPTKKNTPGCGPASGFVPGSASFKVPQTHQDPGHPQLFP